MRREKSCRISMINKLGLMIAYVFKSSSAFSLLQIKSDDKFIRTEQGLLIRSLQKDDSGIYHCQAVEHGFVQALLRVSLEVIDTERLEELLHKEEESSVEGGRAREGVPQSTSQKVWYRDFMSLINHPNLNSVEEFCDQVWRRERRQRRQKTQSGPAHAGKWKHLQDNKKGRNRRTHELERAPRSVWVSTPMCPSKTKDGHSFE